MLFVQSISIYYHKDVRYPNFAKARNSVKFLPIEPDANKFYPREINNNTDTLLNCEVMLQSVDFSQDTSGLKMTGEIFKKYNDEIFTFGKTDGYWRYRHIMKDIRMFKKENNYKINFFDDKFGYVKRQGHNDSYLDKGCPYKHKNILNETAFILKPNEYGRIVYNQRYMYHDCGIWYYGLHIYNFINCEKADFKRKMFFNKNPDHLYTEMRHLY